MCSGDCNCFPKTLCLNQDKKCTACEDMNISLNNIPDKSNWLYAYSPNNWDKNTILKFSLGQGKGNSSFSFNTGSRDQRWDIVENNNDTFDLKAGNYIFKNFKANNYILESDLNSDNTKMFLVLQTCV
jgi:hypothetical protein